MELAPPRILAALAALTALLVIAAPAASATPESTDAERIDAWITERMSAHDIPGAAVAVVQDGETVHLRGYGTADPSGRPVTPETPFLIGSVSKPFTANVVLQLVDEGLLSLDEPVLPHLAHLVDTPPEGFEDVTVRHLLSHTSGLGMLVGLAGNVPVHTSADALDRRVADVLAQPLVAAPGERFEYSNAGPMLLAAVVEQVTGDPFDQVLGDRVFGPLGMSDSFASEQDPAASGLATGHQLWFGRWRPAQLPYDRAGVAMGYIGSSAQDLARFLHAHLDQQDQPFVPASAAQIAHDDVEPTGADEPFEANHGLGWFVDDVAGRRAVSHAGSLGHFTTQVIMVPGADGLGIAVMTNASAFITAGHDGQYDLSLGLARLLLDQEPEPAGRSALLTLVAPVAAWAVVALLIAAAVHYLARTLPRRKQEQQHAARGERRWVRRLALPAAGYLGVGAALLLMLPLGVVRHFYPDVGWALTFIAYLALAWGVLRTLVTVAVLGWPRATAPAARRRRDERTQPPSGDPEVVVPAASATADPAPVE